jgi:hypothetical protein
MNDQFFDDDDIIEEDDVIDITEKEILSKLADVQDLADEVQGLTNKEKVNRINSNNIYDIKEKERRGEIVSGGGDLFDLANDHGKAHYKRKKLIKEDDDPVITSPISPNATKEECRGIDGALSINVIPEEPLDRSLISPIENDKLLSTIKDRKSVNTVMNLVVEELAEEAAYLKAWRNEQWSSGNDVSAVTFKRIKTLKNLVDTLIEQDKLKKSNSIGKVDFYGEAFSRVLKYFLEVIQSTFHKVNIPAQYESIFFPELSKAFDNFEKKAERLYYGKEK